MTGRQFSQKYFGGNNDAAAEWMHINAVAKGFAIKDYYGPGPIQWNCPSCATGWRILRTIKSFELHEVEKDHWAEKMMERLAGDEGEPNNLY